MTEQAAPQDTVTPQKPLLRAWSLFKAIWRRVENFVFGIVLTVITLYLVLQMPAVQNWLIRKITGYLSEELHTTVQIRHVDVSFFDNLIL